MKLKLIMNAIGWAFIIGLLIISVVEYYGGEYSKATYTAVLCTFTGIMMLDETNRLRDKLYKEANELREKEKE